MPLTISKKRKIIQITVLSVIILAAIALTAVLMPYFLKLSDETQRQLFEEKIKSLGVGGGAVMLLLQVAQVVLAIIPGEPVEIIMGVLYGPIGGFLMCTAGIIIGTCAIYFGVRALGKGFAGLFVDPDKFRVFKFIEKKPGRRDMILFFLLFIPGTPKDIITYFAPFTKIKLTRLLWISSFARIPSILSSTYVGDRLIAGDLTASIIIYSAVAVVSVAGIIIYNKFIGRENKTLDNSGKSGENDSTGK